MVVKVDLEIDDLMSSYLEIGYFSNHAINMLEHALQEIYLPLLTASDFRNEQLSDKKASKLANLKTDVLVTVQRFASQITHTAQQVSGETRLKISDDIAALANVDSTVAREDRIIIHKLEILADEWIEIVSSALAKEVKKVPKGNVNQFRVLWQKLNTGEIVLLHSLLFMNN